MPSNQLTIPARYLTILKGLSKDLQGVLRKVQIDAGPDSGRGFDPHPVPQQIQCLLAECQADTSRPGSGMAILPCITPIGHSGQVFRLDSDTGVLDDQHRTCRI